MFSMVPSGMARSLMLVTILAHAPALAQSLTVVEAEATYVMGDGDTLAGAEEIALLRAKRKAVESVGVYIEAVSQDIETSSKGATTHRNAQAVRTITAAITQTEILEKRRSLDGDRLTIDVRIRATVNLEALKDAVKRLQSDEQLAEHQRQLETENTQLKSQLDRLRQQFQTANTAPSEAAARLKDHHAAIVLVQTAMQTRTLPEKVDLASRAMIADDRYVDAYIVRGQTYLRIASVAFSTKRERAEADTYIDRAMADFDHALALDRNSTWALLGHGDALTWQSKMEDAAKNYQRILEIDPLFDLARQRLIALSTTMAQKQAAAKQWRQALVTLERVLKTETTQSWIAQEKDAYLTRSHIYTELGQLDRAIEDLTTVLKVDPTQAQALLLRAKLYRRQMQGRLAKDDFERACALGSEEACSALH